MKSFNNPQLSKEQRLFGIVGVVIISVLLATYVVVDMQTESTNNPSIVTYMNPLVLNEPMDRAHIKLLKQSTVLNLKDGKPNAYKDTTIVQSSARVPI